MDWAKLMKADIDTLYSNVSEKPELQSKKLKIKLNNASIKKKN